MDAVFTKVISLPTLGRHDKIIELILTQISVWFWPNRQTGNDWRESNYGNLLGYADIFCELDVSAVNAA